MGNLYQQAYRLLVRQTASIKENHAHGYIRSSRGDDAQALDGAGARGRTGGNSRLISRVPASSGCN
jgi:hypothetical protein